MYPSSPSSYLFTDNTNSTNNNVYDRPFFLTISVLLHRQQYHRQPDLRESVIVATTAASALDLRLFIFIVITLVQHAVAPLRPLQLWRFAEHLPHQSDGQRCYLWPRGKKKMIYGNFGRINLGRIYTNISVLCTFILCIIRLIRLSAFIWVSHFIFFE